MIVFDLDGTLADCSHRVHLVPEKGGDWAPFHAACGEDEPIRPMVNLLTMLVKAHREVQIWTARPIDVREETERWIKQRIPLASEAPLRMRHSEDLRSSAALKESWLDEALQEGWVIDMVFEDRPAVVAMWRRRGILCCQCAEGNYA